MTLLAIHGAVLQVDILVHKAGIPSEVFTEKLQEYICQISFSFRRCSSYPRASISASAATVANFSSPPPQAGRNIITAYLINCSNVQCIVGWQIMCLIISLRVIGVHLMLRIVIKEHHEFALSKNSDNTYGLSSFTAFSWRSDCLR
jgi:hypothetical protein